ncbi:MAG: HEPN domain-containing protein [Pseudomonadota bacterium]
MLTKVELREIARARLRDSEVLFNAGRYDGAIYLCGYCVEIALKNRICKALNWIGYPSTRKDFENLSSFKTHNLDILLKLSGSENKIKTKFLAEWSLVAVWEPEARYKPIGSASKNDANLMIESARILMRNL